MNIQPIVEGFGDVASVPVLIRRLRDLAELYEIDVNSPIRWPRGKLVIEDSLRGAVQLAKRQEECGAILILFDADDDCPAELAASLLTSARQETGDTACEIVLAKCEYE